MDLLAVELMEQLTDKELMEQLTEKKADGPADRGVVGAADIPGF